MIHHQKPPLGAQLNRSDPFSRGLVGCWLMNEGSGNIIQDCSGNGNNGTLTNMVPQTSVSGWVPGIDGPAINFDGVNDFISVGVLRKTPIVNSFTIIAKINRHAVVSSSDMIVNLNNKIQFCITLNLLRLAGSGLGSIYGNTTLSLNRDYWIAVVYDSVTSTGNLFVNGKKDREPAVLAGVAGTTSNAIIGNYIAGGTYFFNGLIYYVFVYERALINSEILELYQRPYRMFDWPPIHERYMPIPSLLAAQTHQIIGGGAPLR